MKNQEQWPSYGHWMENVWRLFFLLFFVCLKLAPDSSCLLHAFIDSFLCIYENKPHMHQIPFNHFFPFFSHLFCTVLCTLFKEKLFLALCLFLSLHSFFIIFISSMNDSYNRVTYVFWRRLSRILKVFSLYLLNLGNNLMRMDELSSIGGDFQRIFFFWLRQILFDLVEFWNRNA